MKAMLIIVLLFSTNMGCASNTKLVKKYIPKHENPVKQVSVQEKRELRILEFYRRANDEVFQIISQHYYKRGWKDGWTGCARNKPMHINTGTEYRRIEQ